ncbi:MAG: hypothetical protein COA74_10840 [Gammaproteobacteria bacterium]|nr:MAG: hypothetical protein COA74_10840 [Gammaproteobacteria bacterium]
MTFQLSEDGFEGETINNEMYFIPFDIIQRISTYSSDLFSGDELRLEIETFDNEVYTFSEREDCWVDLIDWVRDWANLPEDWQQSEYTEAFSNELTVLWQSSN